jgi:transcriptional regulator with XRE-family HTH domain
VKKRKAKKYFRDDDFLKKIGEKVRQHRKEKGLSQMDLAYACDDTDYSQINRMELGKVNFSVSFLSLVAQKLEIDVKDLLP